jgi:hypothetical protein
MQYFTFTRRRLAGAAAIGMACAAAVMPVASLAGPAIAEAEAQATSALRL